MQECLAIFGGSQFLFILLAFQRLELRACVVVIHFEFQHFFIADGVGNHIRMQFAAKDTRCRFRPQGVIGENWRTGKAELAELLEFLFQILLRLAELRAVAFIEDKNDRLLINRQIVFAFHQIIQFLDGGHDDFVVAFFQIMFQPCRAG